MTAKHLGLPVSGYREQSSGNVQIVNQNKALEELVLRQIDVIAMAEGMDKRWAALAKTHIEQGFMALNRAVFQPARIGDDQPDLIARISTPIIF